MLSHLNGLAVLLEHDTFYPLPAIPIVRSIAEVAATASWVLDAAVDRDTRNARAYATLFRSIDTQVPRMRDESVEHARQLRETLVSELAKNGVRVERRSKNGHLTDEVSQVLIKRGHAKTAFRYSSRIASEIPAIAGLYAGMSGAVHGEQTHVATSWDSPGTSARLIGVVVRRSVEAWSGAVHDWVGAEPGPFVNESDWRNLIRSIPPDMVAQFRSSNRQV